MKVKVTLEDIMIQYEVRVGQNRRFYVKSVREVKEILRAELGVSKLSGLLRPFAMFDPTPEELTKPSDGAELDYWLARQKCLELRLPSFAYCVAIVHKIYLGGRYVS